MLSNRVWACFGALVLVLSVGSAWAQPVMLPLGEFSPGTCNELLEELELNRGFDPWQAPIVCADGFIGPFGQGLAASYAQLVQGAPGVIEAGFFNAGDLNPGGQVFGAFSQYQAHARADNSAPGMFHFTTGAGVSIPIDAAQVQQGGAGTFSSIPLLINDPALPNGTEVLINLEGFLDGFMQHLTDGNGQVTMSGRVTVRRPGESLPVFERAWFAQSSNAFQFQQGFVGGELVFTEDGGIGEVDFGGPLSSRVGEPILVETQIFADGFESGDTSAWTETLSYTLTPDASNPDVTFSIVPEPTSLALLLLGGLGAARRRR